MSAFSLATGTSGLATPAASPTVRGRRPTARWLLLGAFTTLVGAYLVLPTLFIVPMSLNASPTLGTLKDGWTTAWYRQLVEDPVWARTALISLEVGVASTAIATVLGTLATVGMFRVSARVRTLVQGLSLAPMVIPPVILGIGLYVLFLRIGVYGTPTGFVLGHAVLALPFVVVSVSAALSEFDPAQEKAAAVLGAPPVMAFLRVVLPQIAPGIVAGALFGFVTSWDEVVVSTFLVSPGLKTLPVEMWTQSRTTLTPVLAALSTVLMVVSTIVLVVVSRLQARGKGR